jgi:hypothetical protein
VRSLVQTFRFFKPQSLPPQYSIYKGRPFKCHTNAIMLTLSCPELTYCEGYAKPTIDVDPVEHAWCITADGKVVEPTWDKCGIAYWGISLCFVSVCEIMLEPNRVEHIENWKRDHKHIDKQELLRL